MIAFQTYKAQKSFSQKKELQGSRHDVWLLRKQKGKMEENRVLKAEARGLCCLGFPKNEKRPTRSSVEFTRYFSWMLHDEKSRNFPTLSRQPNKCTRFSVTRKPQKKKCNLKKLVLKKHHNPCASIFPPVFSGTKQRTKVRHFTWLETASDIIPMRHENPRSKAPKSDGSVSFKYRATTSGH